jgi:hypothetical protein
MFLILLKTLIGQIKRNVVVVYGSLSLVFAAPLEYLFFSQHTKLEQRSILSKYV